MTSPAAAFADSGGGAGDQEYQDPLTAPAPPNHKHKPAPKTAPAAGVAPASSSGSPSSATSAPAAGSSSAVAATNELPRTGAPAGLVGATGMALIGAGAAMRRRTAQP
jgi:hypothetical protein